MKIAKDKYLRKSEFRYDTNPEVKNPNGEGHTAYVTVRHKKKSKVNIITHAKTFFNEPTVPLSRNTNPSKPSRRTSRFSVPRWENNIYIQDKAKGTWRIGKQDRKTIHKFNKKYARSHKN